MWLGLLLLGGLTTMLALRDHVKATLSEISWKSRGLVEDG
jgi:hypothetical protein